MPYADSEAQSAFASPLTGSWLHDVTDPEGTARQYLFGSNNRTEDIDANASEIELLGRTMPLIEFGVNESFSMDLTFIVPFDQGHDDTIAGLRDLVRLRTTLCYRDGRGRIAFGVLTDLSITDEKFGTTVSTVLQSNNYTEGS